MKKIKKIKIYSNYNVDEISDENVSIINNENNNKIFLKYDELIVCYGIEMLQNNLINTGVLNKIYKLEVDTNCESINQKNLYGVGNINNKKTKDLILISISEIVIAITEIMNKEHKHITHHQ